MLTPIILKNVVLRKAEFIESESADDLFVIYISLHFYLNLKGRISAAALRYVRLRYLRLRYAS